jgi:hypothetical protein
MQRVCGPLCALEAQRAARLSRELKAARARSRGLREGLKTRSEHLKELQAIFNRFIRLRDTVPVDLPCISCQRHHKGQYHAGHFLSRGSHPELRFDEDNCHKQCSACNNHLSGNLVNYRRFLIEKIGLQAVENLEGYHPPLKLDIPQIKELKAVYKAKIKEISANSS